MEDTSRDRRLDTLRAAVRAGTYRADPAAIAAAIVLRALFRLRRAARDPLTLA